MGQAGLIGFMYVGIGLLIMGFTVLLFMVKYELGPVSKLSPGRRLLMMLVLGSGMVAFSIKLIIIATLIKFPEYTIKRNIATQTTPLVVDWEQLNKDFPQASASAARLTTRPTSLRQRVPTPVPTS